MYRGVSPLLVTLLYCRPGRARALGQSGWAPAVLLPVITRVIEAPYLQHQHRNDTLDPLHFCNSTFVKKYDDALGRVWTTDD